MKIIFNHQFRAFSLFFFAGELVAEEFELELDLVFLLAESFPLKKGMKVYRCPDAELL